MIQHIIIGRRSRKAFYAFLQMAFAIRQGKIVAVPGCIDPIPKLERLRNMGIRSKATEMYATNTGKRVMTGHYFELDKIEIQEIKPPKLELRSTSNS